MLSKCFCYIFGQCIVERMFEYLHLCPKCFYNTYHNEDITWTDRQVDCNSFQGIVPRHDHKMWKSLPDSFNLTTHQLQWVKRYNTNLSSIFKETMYLVAYLGEENKSIKLQTLNWKVELSHFLHFRALLNLKGPKHHNKNLKPSWKTVIESYFWAWKENTNMKHTHC